MSKKEIITRGLKLDVTHERDSKYVEVRNGTQPPRLKLRLPHSATIYAEEMPTGELQLRQEPPATIIRHNKHTRGTQAPTDESRRALGLSITLQRGQKVPPDVRQALEHVKTRWGWKIDGKIRRTT